MMERYSFTSSRDCFKLPKVSSPNIHLRRAQRYSSIFYSSPNRRQEVSSKFVQKWGQVKKLGVVCTKIPALGRQRQTGP